MQLQSCLVHSGVHDGSLACHDRSIKQVCKDAGAFTACSAAVQSHPIEALSPALCPPARLGLQDSSLSTPLVYVASGPHEVSLWDVEQSKCHQVRGLCSDAGHVDPHKHDDHDIRS